MSSDPTNPYAPTPTQFGVEQSVPMDEATLAKFNAIIKDSNQFWVAIVLCLLCSGIGGLIIGIWYFVRLLQWNSMNKAYPMLMVENPTPGGMAAKFQAAKVKLIVGLVFGVVMLFLAFAYIVLNVAVGIRT